MLRLATEHWHRAEARARRSGRKCDAIANKGSKRAPAGPFGPCVSTAGSVSRTSTEDRVLYGNFSVRMKAQSGHSTLLPTDNIIKRD